MITITREEGTNYLFARLLSDDDLRNRTTYHARSHFLAHHTYAHRAQTICTCLSDYFDRTKEDYVSTTD